MQRAAARRSLTFTLAILSAVACVTVVLLGCGLLSGSAPGGGGAIAADPVDVTSAADGGRAVSALITPEGGTLTAKSAAGTELTLIIPAGALLRSERITLAPTAVDGLPFTGAQAGAAQLSPDGLDLLVPATLTITSPKVAAAKGFLTAPYGFRGTGTGLYLEMADVKGSTATLLLSHFSGYGVAQATPAEITKQAQHAPAVAEDGFRQRLAELQMTNRQASLRGDEIDPEFADKTEAILRDWYKNVVAPALPGTKECANTPKVASVATSWMRQVELRGMGDQFKAEEAECWNTLAEAQKRCYGGFKAIGGYDQGTHSGDVPDLEKPFTILITTGPAKTTLEFTPTSKEAGSLTADGSYPGVAKFTGSGTYTVKDAESPAPVLLVNLKSTTSVAGISVSDSRTIPIQLVLKGR